MIVDTFKQDYEKCLRQSQNLKRDLKNRGDILLKNQSTVKVEAIIKVEIKTFSTDLQSLDELFQILAENPSKFSLMRGDLDQRKRLLQQLQNDNNNFIRLSNNFQRSYSIDSTSSSMTNNNFNTTSDKKLGFSDSYDLENMTTRDIILTHKVMLNHQEEQVGELINVVEKIKFGQETMSMELDSQKRQLVQLENGIDHNNMKFIKVNNKLLKLLKKSSNCKLYLMIILQMIILFLLIFY